MRAAGPATTGRKPRVQDAVFMDPRHGVGGLFGLASTARAEGAAPHEAAARAFGHAKAFLMTKRPAIAERVQDTAHPLHDGVWAAANHRTLQIVWRNIFDV